jgi:hypothetical protein
MATAAMELRTQAQPRAWWSTRGFALAAVLATAIPLLWPPFPPLTDALEHAGRFRMMLDGNATGPLAQWYTITWKLVGNMGCDVIVALLGPLIGLEPAVKLVAIGIVMLTAAGCLAISRVAHGQVSPFALFALPLVYNHSFHMGFLNFSLAMALALNAFALWLWMAGHRWRGVVFVPIALSIWGSHVFGWGVLCVIGFAAEWSRTRNPFRAAMQCWPFAAPLPVMLLWRSASAGETFGFFELQSKLIALLMSFRDSWFMVDFLTFAVVLGALAFGVRRATSVPSVAWAAVALLGVFAALPIWLMGSAFADTRAAPFVLMLALLALRPADARQATPVAWAAFAFCTLRIAATTASLALASQAQAREVRALDFIPVGARVVQFVSPNCADGWRMARLDHIGGLAQVRRRAFTNSQFPDIGSTLLSKHYPAAGRFIEDPSHLLRCDGGVGLRKRLDAVPWHAFDRLWLVDIPEGAPAALPGLTLLWSDGDSAVYRVERR